MKEFDITEFNSKLNIYIRASAGTGKTYTVQQIVAKLLKENAVDSLEEILIVTYTEKAAGELRDRIREKIQNENLNDQLALIDNAPIYTIHSFCKQALDEFSFSAGQTNELTLIDEASVSDFVSKWIRDELPKDPEAQKLLEIKEAIENSDSIENFFCKDEICDAIKFYYCNKDGQEDPSIVTLLKTSNDKIIENYDNLKSLDTKKQDDEVTLKEVFEAFCIQDEIEGKNSKSVYERIAEFMTNLEVLYRPVKDKKTSVIKKLYEALKNDIDALFEKKKFKKLDADYAANCGDSNVALYFHELKERLDSFKSFFGDLRKSPDSNNRIPGYIEQLKERLLVSLVKKIYFAWYEYKAKNQLQSFDDMIRNVREAVCEPDSQLKKKLQAKYKYAIIDEFQDTNQKQWDIFKRIFMEDEEHSICVVGDPKQSIYAFQGADVNVYTAALKDIEKGNPEKGVKAGVGYELAVNHRSSDKLINACNELFKYEDDGVNFFDSGDIEFTESKCPEEFNSNEKCGDQKKPDSTFDGKPTPALWQVMIPANDDADPEKKTELRGPFAKAVTEKIIQCCSFVNGKTRLQIYKKDYKDKNGKYILGNVSFGDFAVLSKSKDEMADIKREFKRAGIPFNHYKESNLFDGKECLQWISLFKAISCDNFSGQNRKILTEVLFTDFFAVDFNNLSSPEFDRPDCAERAILLDLRLIASERKWALLQEKIFSKTKIESRLSKLDSLTELTKIRQLGDYCVNYLYNNNCSLDELINHLVLLNNKKTDADEENGDLVEKGSDFNAVQLMTVHASKGLAFPVVISTFGLSEKNNMEGKAPYLFHHDSKTYLSFEKRFKLSADDNDTINNRVQKESNQEKQRLFYVAYTRATSLMIIPNLFADQYELTAKIFEKIKPSLNAHVEGIEIPEELDYRHLQKEVSKIIQTQEALAAKVEDSISQQDQQTAVKKFAKEIVELNTHKLSYSNLSHDKRKSDEESDNSGFDSVKIKADGLRYDSDELTKIDERYPKGNLLGEAVHQTFEGAEFKRLGSLSLDDIKNDDRLSMLINKTFSGQGFKIDEDDSKGIKQQTCTIVWNTLNARLPVIIGNKIYNDTFALKNLKDNEHLAEAEFNMNPAIKHNLSGMRDYFNGFIDLLFVREVEGKKIYSVLDWKTDSMDAFEYADSDVLEEHTNKSYSIQRVLYSYCVIKWLKQFINKTEEELFNEHFGGVYYVYVRGCKAETSNGIYAQTWADWKTLENAFNEIVKLKIPLPDSNEATMEMDNSLVSVKEN